MEIVLKGGVFYAAANVTGVDPPSDGENCVTLIPLLQGFINSQGNMQRPAGGTAASQQDDDFGW